MNSLTELNNYSKRELAFQDDRPPTFIWTDDTPDHQYITCLESEGSFTSPTATTLTQMYSAEDYLSFTVNVAALPGSTVTWPSAPETLPVTGNVDTGIYTISGLNRKSDWLLMQNPVITMGSNPPDLWNYTSTINYNFGNTKTWITSVSVLQVDQLTTASNFFYTPGVSQIILNTPSVFALNIANTEPSSYSCNVSASDNTIFGNLSVSGGSFIGNVLSFSGNLSIINQKLDAISFWPKDNVESTWVATYKLYNPLTQYESTSTQTIVSLSGLYLSQPSAFYYDEDLTTKILNTPLVTDLDAPNTTSYTMTVTSVESNSIQTLSSTGSGGSTSFNGTTKTLTLTGTKAQINSHLGNISYIPPTDFVTNFNMRYSLTVPGGNVAIRNQPALKSALNTTISNMNLSRSFVSNTPDQLVFPTNVPQILENITGASYTIQISSTAGKFGLNSSTTSSNYTYTGSKAQCNTILSTIKFYPLRNVTGNQTFIYKQLRNSVLQTQQTVSYVGTARTTPIPGANVYSFTTTQTFTPTYEQANYLVADVCVVGGGGGGGGLASTSSGGFYYYGGGGGGGGRVTTASSITIPSSCTITVGAQGTTGSNLSSSIQYAQAGSGTTGGTSSITGSISYSALGGTGGSGGSILNTGGDGGSSTYPGATHPTVNSDGGGGGGAGGPAAQGYSTGGIGVGTVFGTFGAGGAGGHLAAGNKGNGSAVYIRFRS